MNAGGFNVIGFMYCVDSRAVKNSLGWLSGREQAIRDGMITFQVPLIDHRGAVKWNMFRYQMELAEDKRKRVKTDIGEINASCRRSDVFCKIETFNFHEARVN